MAQRTVVELIDDIDGGTADESVTFGLDGVEYTIDLSDSNADRLRKALEEYIDHARRVGGRKQRGSSKVVAAGGGDKAQNQAIREWARNHGHQVSDRGRIPQELVVKFQAAKGS